MLRQSVQIINKLGLHARAAAKLVSTASRFESTIEIERLSQRVNGKSIMGVMMLAASMGSEIDLIIDGRDEKLAMSALLELINNRFGEDE